MKKRLLSYLPAPDDRPALYYVLLLFASVYTLFHFVLLPYYTAGETAYWYEFFIHKFNTSGFNAENSSARSVWIPLLKYVELNMQTLRLIYGFAGWAMLSAVYWKTNLSVLNSYRDRLFFCLVLCTTPVFPELRGLPAGFIHLLNMLLTLYFLEMLNRKMQNMTGGRWFSAFIICMLLTGVNGLLPVLMLSFLSGLMVHQKKPAALPLLLLTGSMLLFFGLFRYLLNFEFNAGMNGYTLNTDLLPSLYKLREALGLYLIPAGMAALLLALSSSVNRQTASAVAAGLWFLVFTILLLYPSALDTSIGLFSILNSVVLSLGLKKLFEWKVIQQPRIAFITSCVILVFFFYMPFKNTVNLHTSSMGTAAAELLEAKPILYADVLQDERIHFNVYGNYYDTTSAILLSIATLNTATATDQLSGSGVVYLAHRKSIEKIPHQQIKSAGPLILFTPVTAATSGKKKASTIAEAEALLSSQMMRIQSDETWMKAIRDKIKETGAPLRLQLKNDALWSLWADSLISDDHYNTLLKKKTE